MAPNRNYRNRKGSDEIDPSLVVGGIGSVCLMLLIARRYYRTDEGTALTVATGNEVTEAQGVGLRVGGTTPARTLAGTTPAHTLAGTKPARTLTGTLAGTLAGTTPAGTVTPIALPLPSGSYRGETSVRILFFPVLVRVTITITTARYAPQQIVGEASVNVSVVNIVANVVHFTIDEEGTITPSGAEWNEKIATLVQDPSLTYDGSDIVLTGTIPVAGNRTISLSKQ